MSYSNQPDHKLLDRKTIGGILTALLTARVEAAPTALTRDQQFERLSRLAGSDLERRWLKVLTDGGYRLPSDAAKLFEAAHTRPDFFYADDKVVIYVDGPPHDHADRHQRDVAQQQAMEDLGYIVLRFRHDEDWGPLLKKYPSVFGGGK
jgi:hypothetical protein